MSEAPLYSSLGFSGELETPLSSVFPFKWKELPLETRKVRRLNVALFNLYTPRGAVSHAPADIRRRVINRIKRGKSYGTFMNEQIL